MSPIAGDERLDHFLAKEIASVAGGAAGRCTASGPLVIFAFVVIRLRFGRNGPGADQVRLVQDDDHRTGWPFDLQNLRSTMLRFLRVTFEKTAAHYCFASFPRGTHNPDLALRDEGLRDE